MTRLMELAKYHKTQIAVSFIHAGASPHIQNRWEQTALYFAAASDDLEIANSLVAAGATIDFKDRSIPSAFINAV